MSGESNDARKKFILTTTGNFYELNAASALNDSPELNNFLDDGNVFVLSASRHENKLQLSNKIEALEGSREKVLVFFKLYPTVITEENLHHSVLVSSMLESPINTLYQAVRQVFAPVLLKDERWRSAFDPKLAGLLSELELGLGSVVRQSGAQPSASRKGHSEEDVLGILTPSDEFLYWADICESAKKADLKERASYFTEQFNLIEKEYCGLDGLSMSDVLDLVEQSRDTLDGVWRQLDYKPYPETRMVRLMDVIGGALGRYVQKKLSDVKIFERPFVSVKENLKMAVTICQQWVAACEHLSGQVWKRHAPHAWKGNKHCPQTLHCLGKRLDEVLSLRIFHEKLLRLLPGGKQQALSSDCVFEPFSGLSPLQYNPYTEPLWRAAVAQFERMMAPSEREVAGRLKSYIADVQDNPQQLLQVFQKHKELIRRSTVRHELQSERDTLLARLLDYNKGLKTDFESRCHGSPGEKSGPLVSRNLSDVVNKIVWVQHIIHKVEDCVRISEALLSDLSGFKTYLRFCDDLLEVLRAYEEEQFEDWSRDVLSGLADPKSGLSLQASDRVMELDHGDGRLKIHYSDRLVSLLREVRQLSALGFAIPAKIQLAANTADKFHRQAIVLKQVANFYNTIDQQMIPSQRPMMLTLALAFEQVIKNPRAQSKDSGGKLHITWNNPKELEMYISKLQSATEKLSTENRKLRKWHTDFIDKVVTLMNVDLLRHQQRWKEGLQELRTGFSTLEAQGFRSDDMRAWRQHWNHQLYKGLEHQYQTGLEALNKNLPEIHIDLTFKQGRLQFQPPFEEVRARYYREMKRFISIPNQFRGVSAAGDQVIFSAMIDRNASGFLTVFSKAEDLFSRLQAIPLKYKDWVVLGQVDLEKLLVQHLTSVQDWEANFKALKARGKESERLPSQEKVDCITVNCEPLKTAIDGLIQRLFDLLLMSLRKSIQGHMQAIDTFVSESMDTLSTRPENIEEIGASSGKYNQILVRKPEILPQFKSLEEKNRLLRVVSGAGVDSLSPLRARWDKLELVMESHQLMIKDQVEVMRSHTTDRINAYKADLERFKARWDQLKPKDEMFETGDRAALLASLQIIKDKQQEFQELELVRNKLTEDCAYFDLEASTFPLAEETKQDMEEYSQMWGLYEEWYQGFTEKAQEDWISFRSKTYLFEEFLFTWQDKLRKLEQPTAISVKLQEEVDKYKNIVPVLKYVRGEHLSQDHWLDMFRLLGLPRGMTLEKLSFNDLLAVSDNILAKALELKDLNSRAQAEVTIREALRELDLWGAAATFTLTEYSGSSGSTLTIIKDWKDIVSQVGDNRCLLQSLKDSPYYRNFHDKVSLWEVRLSDLDEYLLSLNAIQRRWVYLEPIFGRGALPREEARFKRVDEDFRSIMSDIQRDNRVVSLSSRAGIRNSLVTIMDQLQRCQKSLNEFLEEKRSAFPRFYFIGDDDLLEILGQATNPTVILSHLKKLFAGIHSVVFDDGCQQIVAMCSLEGEVVPLRNRVRISSLVEVWLNDLSNEMKETLKQMLHECVTAAKQGEVDPSRYPSQILCLAEQIQFTDDVERALKDQNLQQLELELTAKLEHYTTGDTASDDHTNTDPGILQLKLKALILDIIHNISVVKQLKQAGVSGPDAWAWQKQLRFYMGPGKCCQVHMVDAHFSYTYEYQGNAAKLVHTPLTDKCYLTLTQAMKMGLGGNPYGPAGTGKTESVKALGGLFGRQVLVFNCDEGIDVKSMGRIFVGLVKCGAWGCFDEFNRLEEAVLSAVSMQIQAIQDSLKHHKPTCQLMGREVELNPNSGVFITMNPAGKGYGGRQKLPDNLKQLFRPVAMSKPDNDLIAEVILYSEGFKEGEMLGGKLVAIFNLSRELLTPQQHYDWGLRALKTVLKACGRLLQQQRRSHDKDKIQESNLVVQALRLNTMSKLTFADSSRFDALLRDVFSGVDFTDVEDAALTQALEQVYKESRLEPIPTQLKKALELNEQLRQRMGVVIVGPSGAGKSTLWRTLRAALNKTGRVVKLYTMNPKAMPKQQLLGHMDMDTREWADGVLTHSARNVVKESQDVSSWMVCDGDIDPEWVESLNSVLDDNRLLTMPSGERIQFGPNVNFLFETHDLSCASPATISRMGMIFLSDEDIDVGALVKSWLLNQPEQCRSNLEGWLGDYFQQALDWVFKQNDFVVETSLVGSVFNGLSHLSAVTERGHFLVGLLRGLGGNLNLKTRQEFARELLSWARESPPNSRKPLDTYYDHDSGHLAAYTLQHSDSLTLAHLSCCQSLPVIETADMQRALHCFSTWLTPEHRQPFMVVGPEGCGKGMLLRFAFSRLRSTQVAVVHCSAQTWSRHVLQKLGQTCLLLSSNTGRVFRPKDCENLVLYLKDINLPKPDKWGTSNLAAFLQQVLTYKGFYDENLEWVSLENIQVVASMSTGGAVGSHSLTSRFTSIVRICTIDYPDQEQLQTIYSAYLQPILRHSLGSQASWASSGKTQQLAASLVQLYEQVKAKFTVDDHSHYLFTPCVLTEWVLSLLRYDLTAAQSDVTDSVLEVVAHEARRLFRDRLVSSKDLHAFDNMLSSIIRGDWGSDALGNMADGFYVTWGVSEGVVMTPGQTLPPHGKQLGRLSSADLKQIIQKGLVLYSRDNRELDLLLFWEVCDFVSRLDRVLSRPGGSLLLAGRSGVGRHTATFLVSHMHAYSLVTPKISRGYSLKHFKTDLKTVMQLAGIEGQQVVFLLEDYQFVHAAFLEMVNSLLSSGEVPGLYTPEELEPLLSSLKDAASQDGFTGPLYNYFSFRIQQNLHVVLIMDCSNPNFTISCESNPAFYRRCSVQWMEGWSESSMKKIPELLLAKTTSHKGEKSEAKKGASIKTKSNVAGSGQEEVGLLFLTVHESCREDGATPSQYLAFLHLYGAIYGRKQTQLTTRQQHLQAGVSKLNEAKALVDELKRRAAEQSMLLKSKQQEADSALQEITNSMQNASDQKAEMEKIKARISEEVSKIEERKAKIDDELKEVKPLVDEAKHAVGNIRPEALSEIRSLRMPPDVIRDILEGVLRLMGTFDTSWVSMKSFLAKRGVREDIVTFEARNITPEIRQSVEELLSRNRTSFDPKNAKRASAAAAPLAAWVKANVQYSHVLQRIEPLEREQAGLKDNLKKTENRKNKLENQLDSVGAKVNELKEKFQCHTAEAAKLESEVTKAQDTINAAQKLISQLDGEHKRWNAQMCEIKNELETLPVRAMLAAAFITYLSAASEDRRRRCLESWMSQSGLQKFDFRSFLSLESEQLIWKSQGLPSDDLSMENAIVILQISQLKLRSVACPFLIDPSSRATEWLCAHLAQNRLEVINQQDSNFMTTLELAVRFGKTLIIQEMDGVEPVLYPLLRRDLIAQGPRYVVQIGDKVIDYNEDFRLFLATRNPAPFIPPDAVSVVTEINFTTTRAGLRGQLLALTIQHEKPELETEKTRLLQHEEDKKIQLAQLEETLLETLATSQGNILENRELIDSLNQAKASSALIQQSLLESHRLQTSLDQERDAYLPLAESASKMYFVITDLSKINNMYRFSLASFLRLFQRALQAKQDVDNTEARITALEASLKNLVYEYVCRSLFKVDQLMFAMHFSKGMYPDLFKENEWDVFIGSIVGEMFREEDFPSWIHQERHRSVAVFKATFPALYQTLALDDSDLWQPFARSSHCEQEVPSTVARKVTAFQQLLLVQAVRPDRLQSAMTAFASQALGMSELSPPPLNLRRLHAETLELEPVLIITSPGADPSQELAELAVDTVGRNQYHEISMGQGQADVALASLRECSRNGEWLCLKNLHLVTAWLPLLEKELNALRPTKGFRLWMTSEVHPRFPPILLQSSLKITYEDPPGLKRNLLRTYESWSPEQISRGGKLLRAQSLFCLAWFHAVCQERRNYIPQGWTKFYEFSLSDLRAGFEILDRLFEVGKPFQWEFVHGLLESAIYGGRIDNPCDLRILRSYLEQFFSARLLSPSPGQGRSKGARFLPAQISLPNSCSILDYREVIGNLPEDDRPVFFGLPANIERTSQRTVSSQVISQLRVISRSVATGSKFDRELWSNGLSPILNLWKKLNKGSTLIQQKVTPPTDHHGSPVLSFTVLEQFNAIRLVQSIHQSLAALSKVIRGTELLTPKVQKLATALLNQECPLTWQDMWEGPEEPMQYLGAIVMRALALQSWVERASNQHLLSDTLDLSELFHPDTFLNALRQETARSLGCSMDSLVFASSWRTPLVGAKLQVKVGGLQLEGCGFDGVHLCENQHDSPSVSAVPLCYMAWLPQGCCADSGEEDIWLPVYSSPERLKVVTQVCVPCRTNHSQWIQTGAALFLKQ
ncbi:dynein cytoplasmic 2 heavy chain 1 isoform X1 [Entelurus aequoreus]|uniref:dynein cytoplasmic 2 heavy chain 1 isoform X1 n=1 Tax=Entelurus aequoreus TaxID=161455 RepID=UPI002B1E6583|nr:dynein cytoplasmic 2 heavy chain 1 isoform X1 [Entelurus aequoreus]XP_061923240.1 dynein cytoplasmic 2 heavy chain 1 isoform X1 [Entelurus aequoreus]XP_061923241.1 dynein cytoplasmic 2 heavy chain 1 isoform X1 [Entelurus aequoreus]